MYYKFKQFSNHYSSKSLELFAKDYQAPLLLIEKLGETGLGYGTTYVNEANSQVMLLGAKLGAAPSTKAIIFDFGKVKASQKYLISVGRATNNSVCLKDKSVSKFHAYFRKSSCGRWEIVDAGSDNGTVVNGEVLETKKSRLLSEFDSICFSCVYKCTFFSPEKFYEYITSLR